MRCRGLREQRDPQLLDHPADVDDVGGGPPGGAQGLEQVGVGVLRRDRPARGPGRRAPGWRRPGRAGAAWRAGSGRRSRSRREPGVRDEARAAPARAAGRGRRRRMARTRRGCVAGRARRGGGVTCEVLGEDRLDEPDDLHAPGRPRGCARRRAPPRRPPRCAPRPAAVLGARWRRRRRRGSRRAGPGTDPCGLSASASFWALLRRASTCFHGGGDVEQQQPAHPEAVLGVAPRPAVGSTRRRR